MLTIETEVKTAKGKGLGLFAKVPIAKGERVWYFEPLIDRYIGADAANAVISVDDRVRAFFEKYCDFDGKRWFVNGDDTRFMNHSDTPNVVFNGDTGVAARNISPGEELTCDYNEVGCKINFKIK